MPIMSKDGLILTRPSGGILATDCGDSGGGDEPSTSCQDCANNCVGASLTLTLSGFESGTPYSWVDCTALNQTWVVPYEPLSYGGVVYAPCRWAIANDSSEITVECDAYVAYPQEWTISVRLFDSDGIIACATTFYKGTVAGKTGPVALCCSGDHPTGSGPIYTGDGGSWICGYDCDCEEQTGEFTIS